MHTNGSGTLHTKLQIVDTSKLEKKNGNGRKKEREQSFFSNSYTSESLEFFQHKHKSCIV